MSLPYRLRPPVYGGKLKAQKRQESDGDVDDELVGGGPTQRAIQQDLIELRSRFLENVAPGPSQNHSPCGSVFASFKEVFSDCKVALLHSRTIPPRCDRDAYSQLIYSACLSMLKDSVDENGCFQPGHAAFALFCMYALYETNPLRKGTDDDRSKLEMLPLGLQAENPKALFRRSFKTPIRIDRQHYLLLQRLRDEALARQADCRADSFERRENHIIHDSQHRESIGVSCCCGISTDTIHVLDRLFTSDSFDFTEYTGPCGLEGLAGHEDYPFRCTRPKRKKSKENLASLKDDVMTDAELDVVGLSEVESSSNDLSNCGQTYWSYLDSIRSPPIRKKMPKTSSQIQSTLQTLWESQRSRTSWSKISGKSSIAARHDAPGGVDSQAPSRAPDALSTQGGDETVGQLSTVVGESDDGALTYRVVLPHDLPVVEQNGIKDVLGRMMEREGASLLAQVDEHHRSVTVTIPPIVLGQSPPSPSIDINDDGTSVGQQGAPSVTSSLATGMGQVALRKLLLTASNASRTTEQVAASSHQRRRVDETRRSFLTMESKPEAEKEVSGSLSEVSELSSDDDVSVAAASAVGQTALRQLLATVDPASGKAKKRNRSRTNSQSQREKGNSHARKRRKKPTQNKSTLWDEDSFASIAKGTGKAALDALLSRVTSGGVARDDSSEDDGSSVV